MDTALSLVAEMDRLGAPALPLRISIPGTVRGKGRARSNGKRRFVDPKTENAEAWVKACCINQAGQPVLAGPLSVHAVLHVEIPESWSGKRKREALAGVIRPTGKPDVDNSCKLLFDALNKLAWGDDAQVVELHVFKFYGPAPGADLVIDRPAAPAP